MERERARAVMKYLLLVHHNRKGIINHATNHPLPGESEIDIRQVFEAEDFGVEFTPELNAQKERLRAQVAKSQ